MAHISEWSNEELIYAVVTDTVCNIGQLTKKQCRFLNSAVKKGMLSKGRGGYYANLKTVYAVPGFDFAKDRKDYLTDLFAKIEAWEGKKITYV